MLVLAKADPDQTMESYLGEHGAKEVGQVVENVS